MNLNIGIIGGCMMCQPGLKLSELYFRQFSHLIGSNYQLRPHVSFGYYNEFYKTKALTEYLFQKDDLDLMLFQIRPFVLLARSEFVISDYKGGFILNPLLFNKSNYRKLESILERKEAVIRSVEEQRWWDRMYLKQLYKYSFKLSKIFQLQKRLKQYLLDIILELKNTCEQKNCQLIVYGPLPGVDMHRNSFLNTLNNYMVSTLTETNISYIDLYNLTLDDINKYLAEDKIHLGKSGHKLLATQLLNVFENIA